MEPLRNIWVSSKILFRIFHMLLLLNFLWNAVQGDIADYNSGLDTPPGLYRTYLRVGLLWENGIVPYIIDTSVANDDARMGALRYAFRVFEKYTCIRFREKKDTDEDYIRFIDGGALRCYSFVGRVGGGQELSFGAGCEVKIGIILHELFHALSFLHEHSRPDRDNYVHVLYRNIRPGKDQQFEKFSRSIAATQGFPYDYSSVMHYDQFAFSQNGKPTLKTIEGSAQSKIGQRDGFSACDLHRVNTLYNCRVREAIPDCRGAPQDSAATTPTTTTTTSTTTATTTTSTTTATPTTATTATPPSSSPSPTATPTLHQSTTSETPHIPQTSTPAVCVDEVDFCSMAGSKPYLCNMYPGLFIFKCKKSCNNCDVLPCCVSIVRNFATTGSASIGFQCLMMSSAEDMHTNYWQPTSENDTHWDDSLWEK